MQWLGPRAQNSGNPYAKVIFLVFFVFPSVRNSEKCEKAMKFQSPFDLTQKSKTVIFIATRRSTCENRGFSRIALELIYKAFRRFSGSLPRFSKGERVCIEYRVVGLNARGLGPP